RAHHPYALVAPREGTMGFALYSRYPLTGPATLRARGHSGFAQCARLELPSGPVPICNVHLLPPPPRWEGLERALRTRERQGAEVKAFRDVGGGTGPVLGVGDFNTAEWEPLFRRIRLEFVDAAGSTGGVMASRTYPNASEGPLPPLVRI